MKGHWRVFWMVCGGGCVFGIVLICLGVMLGANVRSFNTRYPFSMISNGFDWDDSFASDGTAVLVDEYEEISNIDFELASGTIEIIEYGGDNIKVEKQSIPAYMEFRCYEEEGTLYIRTNKNNKWKRNSGDGSVYIYVPEGTAFERTKILLGAGILNIGYIDTEQLDINAGAGQIEIDQFQVVNLKSSCGAGQMVMTGQLTGNADIDCGVGEVELNIAGLEEDYDYEVSCGIGRVEIGNSSFNGLINSRRINNNQQRTIDLKCGTGQIEIRFISEEGGDL